MPWESLDKKEKKQGSLLSGFKEVYSFIVGHVEHLRSAGCIEANDIEAQRQQNEKKAVESKCDERKRRRRGFLRAANQNKTTNTYI